MISLRYSGSVHLGRYLLFNYQFYKIPTANCLTWMMLCDSQKLICWQVGQSRKGKTKYIQWLQRTLFISFNTWYPFSSLFVVTSPQLPDISTITQGKVTHRQIVPHIFDFAPWQKTLTVVRQAVRGCPQTANGLTTCYHQWTIIFPIGMYLCANFCCSPPDQAGGVGLL